MAATPVIIVFAPSRFKDEVPFATGYVFLETVGGGLADTALYVRCRTTHGAIRPGIFRKDTKIKVVFRNERRGEMRDVFVVPQSELTEAEIAKSPLLENDLRWGAVQEAAFGIPAPETVRIFGEAVLLFKHLAGLIPKSPRATANLANWNRKVAVRTGGGIFGVVIEDGKLDVLLSPPADPDLVLTVRDPEVLFRWLRDATGGGERLESPALTDLVIEGTIWLSASELETVTRLDRVPRSLRRDGV